MYDDEGDSNRAYLRHAAQKALTCIGEGVVEPLLRIIRDTAVPTEERRQALFALGRVGRRTDGVSETLDECLREGLSGNHDLLKASLDAATGLRDRRQTAHAAEILKLNDQELVGKAADFFSSIPDASVIQDLATALNRWKEMKPHPFSSEFGVKSLLSALVLTGDPSAGQRVLGVISSSLRGDGELGTREALRKAENYSISGLRKLVLTESISQLRRPNAIFRLSDAVEVLSNTWRPDELSELAKTTRRIEGLVGAGGIETIISRYLQKDGDGWGTIFVDDSALLHTLAKCQVHHFAAQAGRLLESADWDFQRELGDVLWIAGKVGAEEALLRKLANIESEHENGEDAGSERYHLIRGLGTCGTERGADMVIESVLQNPRINTEFSNEVLCQLLRRRVLDPKRLIILAESPATHEYAQNFFVEGLGCFDAPSFDDFFGRMLADGDEATKNNAAHFLGWSKGTKVVALLSDLLQQTQSASVAETAARSLRRLKASEAHVEIVKAIERFGPAQRVGLIREAARLKDSSIVKYLKGTTRSNEWTPWERGDLLDAVGEFYDEPWARTILEEWLENTRLGYDTGQQRWAFRVLARHDPNKLLQQAVRLFDDNGIENSARSTLVDLVARLARSEETNPSLLLPLLKRFLCDEEVEIRESVAEELIHISPGQRWQIYKELSVMGSDWAQACGVYSLGFWDSEEGEIERMRYSPIYVVRYFADLALTMRQKRPHVRQLADSFAVTEGAARVSSYLALIQQGNHQVLRYIDERLETESIASVFLRHMQAALESKAKRRRENLMKEEQDLFCKSSRQVAF